MPLGAAPSATPRLDAVATDEIARLLAWRGHRVEFTGTPLAEAVALFNRQNRVQLALADESLGALRVSGVYWTDDPAGFARLIQPTFALRVRPLGEERLEIAR
jgi:transmembrane sensor